MAHGPTYIVQYRRRREKKTDYKNRLNLLKSGRDRLIIRRSNKHVNVQVIRYMPDGDLVIASAHSAELSKFGWGFGCSNIPSAYLTGFLCGVRAIQKSAGSAIVDTGLQFNFKGGNLFAAVKGAIDSGMEIPCDESVFPNEARIKGEHIAGYAQTLGENYGNNFSGYEKKGLDAKNIQEIFEQVKSKIQENI